MIIGGLGGLMSLALGALGLFGFAMCLALIFLGLGIVRQQWFAMTIARLACVVMGIYSLFQFIAIAAVQGMPNRLSLGYAIFMLIAAVVQGYIFWAVGD